MIILKIFATVVKHFIPKSQTRCGRIQSERGQVTTKAPVKPPPRKESTIPPRNESLSQRTVRENAALAASNRQPTNPKIPQSKLKVIKLPDGREILKKANASDQDGFHVDIGNKLGRGERFDKEGNGPK